MRRFNASNQKFFKGIMDGVYALILAGGRGTRFWPLSRRDNPKQCIELGGERPLLAQTVERLQKLVPIERILIGTGVEMEAAVRRVLPELPKGNVLVEPWGRNTSPCIGWGAVEVGRRDSSAVLVVCPSDHVVADEDELIEAIRSGVLAARSTNHIVTLGIEPTRPETGFGYLELGPLAGTWGNHEVSSVARFVEKPNPETAQRYMEGGGHLWNAGMFVFTVGSIRDAYRAHLPRSAEALERIARDASAVPTEWGNLDATSIDYGIMERERHILTIRLNVGWSDVGTWAAAGQTMPKIPGGHGVAGEVFQRDSTGCIVHAPGKAVALLGLDGIVVVDTPDAILVMHADRSQQVGDLVRAIEENGLKDLT